MSADFVPIPPKLTFSKYEAFKHVEKLFRFRNQSKKNVRVKFVLPDSEYFKLLGPTVSGKRTNLISPGLEAKCKIRFMPTEKIDYSTNLVVYTSDQKFRIPINANVGSADIQFPPDIKFSSCPVKYQTEKVLYVLNNGERATRFTLSCTPAKIFTVEPTEVFLRSGEGKQFIFGFHPMKSLSYQGTLKVDYEEEGIEERISMTGIGANVRVRLSQNSIALPCTFITRKCIKEIFIHNKSDIKLKYKFMRTSSQEEDISYMKMKEFQGETVDSRDLVFKNNVFALYPLEGEIWPNSKAYISVIFKPDTEDAYDVTAWCEMSGRQNRVPIKMKGDGKGPDIVFSYAKLDIKEVYIHSVSKYRIYLENRGEIDAHFELQKPKSLFGSKFQFEPDKGYLKGGQHEEINVTFNPNVIGEYFEVFQWKISGRAKPVSNIFAGKVVGPTFKFDQRNIDFGTVSYGFVNIRSIVLKNTSDISMKYKLRIPEDGSLTNKEFEIIPFQGSILPKGTQKIRVEFLSHHLKQYKYSLVVDVSEVGDNLLNIPITATCVVPEISISSNRINYGNCFVKFPYTRAIELVNKTQDRAKYEVQLPKELNNVEITAAHLKGVINSFSTLTAKFTLKVLDIGSAVFPIYIRIIGSNEPPFEITTSYKSLGPIVETASKKLDFGKIQVLTTVKKKVRLFNKCPIPAEYKTSNKNTQIFKILNPAGIIAPNSHVDLQITAFLDESISFKDTCKVIVDKGQAKEEGGGGIIDIKLVARGKGTSLVSSMDLKNLDFGSLFTRRKKTITFSVENKGRNQRQLVWKCTRKKPKPGSDEVVPPQVFTIIPDRAIVNAKETVSFTVEAFSKNFGAFAEPFVCTVPVSRTDVYTCTIKGKFSTPLLKFYNDGNNAIQFTHTHTPSCPPDVQTKLFTMKNISELDLNVKFRTSGPFTLEKSSHALKVNESITLKLYFDPNYKTDKMSSVIRSKIYITYSDHPQTDSVSVVGVINFPNLSFESKNLKVDFDVIPVNSEKTEIVKMINSSKSVVRFNWIYFVKDGVDVAVTKAFDILPIKGVIQPGDTMNTKFIFSAAAAAHGGDEEEEEEETDHKRTCNAICVVDDGPEYQFVLTGDAGTINYKLDTLEIDCGVMQYAQIESREIVLSNTGRVAFEYHFNKNSFEFPTTIQVYPSEGRIKPGKSARIHVRYCPSIPGIINEELKLYITNCEPVVMKVKVISLCPALRLSLKRTVDEYEVRARVNLQNKSSSFDQMLRFAIGENSVISEDEKRKFLEVPSENDDHLIVRDINQRKLVNFFTENAQSLAITGSTYRRKASRTGAPRAASSRTFRDNKTSVKSKFNAKFVSVRCTLSSHNLEFGHIIKGKSRKKKFHVTNVGYLPLTVVLDKKLLNEMGFLLEPSNIENLPPTKSQEMELTMQTKKLAEGKYERRIPICIKNGGQVVINVTGFVVKPRIVVSRTKLSFGSLYVGLCKVITVQLSNNESIKADWSIEEVGGGEKKSDSFLVGERKGSILPNMKKNIEFKFFPTVKKKHKCKFVLKCRYSSNPITINCKGIGEEVNLGFTAEKLDFPPVVPFEKSVKMIKISNDSDIPVELYSLNFDKKYINDVEIMRLNKDKFSEDGYLMIDPQEPGSDLPAFLLPPPKKISPRKSPEKKDEKVEKKSKRKGSSRKSKDRGEKKEKEKDEKVGMGKLIQVTKPKDAKKIIVFYGPPISGKSEVAMKLSAQTEFPVVSMEKLLDGVEITTDPPEERKIVTPDSSMSSSRKRSGRKSLKSRERREEKIIVDPKVEQLKGIVDKLLSETYKDSKGVIFEDIVTDKLEADFIFKTLMGMRKELVVFVFSPRESEIVRKNFVFLRRMCENKIEENKVDAIDEDEYDDLSEYEQELYRKKLKILRISKKKMREFEKKISEKKPTNTTTEEKEDERNIVEDLLEDEKIRIEYLKQLETAQKKKKKKPKRGKKKLEETVLENPDDKYVIRAGDNDVVKKIKNFKRKYIHVAKLFAPNEQTTEGGAVESPVMHVLESFGDIARVYEKVPTLKNVKSTKIDGAKTQKLEIPKEYIKQIIKFPDPESINAELIFDENNKFQIVRDGKTTSRMIIDKRSTIELGIQFCSEYARNGLFKSVLKFKLNNGTAVEYSLSCVASCVYPSIATKKMFAKTVKKGKKGKFCVKKFIEEEKVFDFGPLLVMPKYDTLMSKRGKYKKYFEQFPISNKGEIEAVVDVTFENENETNFRIENKSIVLGKDETKNIVVWCNPSVVGECRNTVVMCTSNNPIPFKFDVRQTGGRPEVSLDKNKVDFGRMLVSEDGAKKSFKITNTSSLPILWSIEEKEDPVKEITIYPRTGKLDYQESCEVFIDLELLKAYEIKKSICVVCMDKKKIVKTKTKDLVILAETYDLKVNLQRIVDFGEVRVTKGSKKSISISNEGKFPLRFKFNIPPRLQKFFKISPSSGVLDGNAELADSAPTKKSGRKKAVKKKKVVKKEEVKKDIEISFRSNREITFKRNRDIICEFFDAENKKEKLGESFLRISLKAMYNEYDILPVNGINFGPLFSGKDRTKKLTIFNRGEFEINYFLFDFDNPPEKKPDSFEEESSGSTTGKRSGSRGGKKKKPKRGEKQKQPSEQLQIEKFFISPTKGTITPKNSVEIEVQFNAEGRETVRKVMGIDISDRNPNDHPNGIPFDLQGESCTPGINTTDFNYIFEEQNIVQKMDDLKPQDSGFCINESLFTFGIVRSKRKVQEKLKITNIMKVPCSIDLNVEAIDANEDTFHVEPKKISLSSHHSEYVTIFFNPVELRNYSAMFNAVVADGDKESEHSHLKIELRGSGSLPQVDVDHPTLKDENSNYLLNFPKTLLNHKKSLNITIRNKGTLPATIRFDLKHYPSIIFKGNSKEIVLKGQEMKTLPIEYLPKNEEEIDDILKMNVLDNHFENENFRIKAIGFEEDVSFENLPDEKDYLSLLNCPLNTKDEYSFTMKSNCEYPLKFRWEDGRVDTISVSPKIGHLHPFATKEVFVTFFSKKPIDNLKQELKVKFCRIKFENENPLDWDDRHTHVKWVKEVVGKVKSIEKLKQTGKSTLKSKRSSRRKKKSGEKKVVVEAEPPAVEDPSGESEPPKTIVKKVEEIDEEPPHTTAGIEKDVTLNVEITANYAKYELDFDGNEKMKFDTTQMLSSRSHELTVKNTGVVSLKYSWVFENIDEAFTITPHSGVIAVKDEQRFVLQFSPKEARKYSNYLILKVANLDEKSAAEVKRFYVSGKSSCPIVHFELSPSEYLKNDLRDISSSQIVITDPNTKVIELHSCGVKIKTTKRFYILNPTNTAYEFVWKKVTSKNNDGASCFNCLTKKGIVKSGKKAEIAFEFTPPSIKTFECLWKFCIPERRLKVRFLVVGHASEPQVYFDTSRINFQTVLIGAKQKSSLRIINREKIPFTYKFGKLKKYNKMFAIFPKSGTIAAESEDRIQLLFNPLEEIPYNFNLVCKVKRKPQRLVCNIKGEGYLLHERMELERLDKSFLQMSSQNVNKIDFGNVELNDKQIRRLCLLNEGKYNLEYKWKFMSLKKSFIEISPSFGTLTKQSKQMFDLKFNPLKRISVERLRVCCKITNGNNYVFSLYGKGSQPQVSFSFNKFDFGPCFLYHSGADYQKKEALLKISNNEVDKAISFEVAFEESPYFEIMSANTILKPGEKKVVPIVFTPREHRRYKQTFRFVVNGLTKYPVTITGEGVPIKVDLVEKSEGAMNLGAIRVGQSSRKSVTLQNRSKLTARVKIPPKIAKSLEKNFITLSSYSFEIPPKTKHRLVILFQPMSRLQSFTNVVKAKIEGKSKRLFSVGGACLGVEVKLNVRTLAFGIVVQNTVVHKEILIENHGDIGVNFKWNTSRFRPDFSISPDTGYITPNESIPLKITYKPVRTRSVKYENLECRIEGSKKSCLLNLTGVSVSKPSEETVVKFSTAVRQKEVKKITLKNPTEDVWRLKPSFECSQSDDGAGTSKGRTKKSVSIKNEEAWKVNPSWTGDEFLEIAPNSSQQYSVVYAPLFMTSKKRSSTEEKGSIFFPLPNGNAYLFQLFGEATEPEAADTIEREMFAKELFTDHLIVENWLEKSQRFKIYFDFPTLKSPNQLNKSADFIDVPGLVKKKYKFSFYPYTEGTYEGKVVFKNESNKEFLFYNLKLVVNKAKVLKNLVISSPIRSKTEKQIVVQNPMDKTAEFKVFCDNCPEIHLASSTLKIPAKSQGFAVLTFFPLLPTNKEGLLRLENVHLGVYSYNLQLTSTGCGPERCVTFKASLGNRQKQLVSFKNHTKVNTEYSAKFDVGANFSLQSDKIKVMVADGSKKKVTLEVLFEPSKIGEFRDKLTLSSKEGGDYVFNVVGKGVSPQPQGPIVVMNNGSESIQFKNVLNTKMEYRFTVNNGKFHVKPQSSAIGPKQKVNISVAFKGGSDTQKVENAKLIIEGKNLKSKWVYYLSGRFTGGKKQKKGKKK